MHPHGARLRAGSATEDVTPAEPVPLAGYGAREGRSTGIDDRLSSTALVLDDGAVTVALVSVDLLNVSRELTSGVRGALERDGVALDELLLAATHTHAGPYVPARALDASPVLGTDEDVSGTVADLERGIVRSVERAYERLEPAQIRVGRAREDDVQHNRRASGGVGGNVRLPHGPVDPEVTVLLVEPSSGTPTVVYNFACHPVCTTGDESLVSADWPGYARRCIDDELGGARVLYLNGAAADINPRGATESRSHDGVYEYMDRVGTQVGDAVVRALEAADSPGATTIERAPIRTDAADVCLPVKSTPPAETIREHVGVLEERLEALERDGDETGYAKVNWDRRYARELLAIAEWDARRLPTRLPYVEVGDVGVLGMPGEVFARHGLRLKDHSHAETLLPAGYVGGYVGYVPTLSDLENGGYEVRTAKVAPEAIVEFREAARSLVGENN